jgi:hypothetical protein
LLHRNEWQLLALSQPNPPGALKAAFGIGKRTLGQSLARPRGAARPIAGPGVHLRTRAGASPARDVAVCVGAESLGTPRAKASPDANHPLPPLDRAGCNFSLTNQRASLPSESGNERVTCFTACNMPPTWSV